jgi:hypothetical protein
MLTSIAQFATSTVIDGRFGRALALPRTTHTP